VSGSDGHSRRYQTKAGAPAEKTFRDETQPERLKDMQPFSMPSDYRGLPCSTQMP
jgi:hypothetical protein